MAAKRPNQPNKNDPTEPMKRTEKENDPTRIKRPDSDSNSSSGNGKKKNDDYRRSSKIKIGK